MSCPILLLAKWSLIIPAGCSGYGSYAGYSGCSGYAGCNGGCGGYRSAHKTFSRMLLFFIRRPLSFSWATVLVITSDMFVTRTKDTFFPKELSKFPHSYWNSRDFKWLRIFFSEPNMSYPADKWKSRLMRGFTCIGKTKESTELCQFGVLKVNQIPGKNSLPLFLWKSVNPVLALPLQDLN